MPEPFLDRDRHAILARILEQGLGVRRVCIEASRRLSGGAVQENWSVRARIETEDGDEPMELVVRTDALAALQSSLSRLDEYQVLRAAWAAGVRVPEPLFVCDDATALGRVFYVMRKAPGVASAHTLVKAELDGDALVASLGGELARLHTLRPPWPGLECLPLPDREPAAHRIETYRQYLDAISSPQPTLEWALRWLERNAPPDRSLALCHGDFRTGNYLVEAGRLCAILDWEFAAWSHPYEDIGWFCARCWRFGRDRLEAGGMGAREAFYLGYDAASDIPIERGAIAYWEIMATVRWAVIALQQGERYLSGEERALEPALTARMAPDMELDLLDQIEGYHNRTEAC